MNRIWKLLVVVTVLSPSMAWAQAPLELTFKGRVESMVRVDVPNQVTGVVREIFFKSGQHVKQNDPMFSIDNASYRISVNAAEAALAPAQENFDLKKDIADRREELRNRDTAADAKTKHSELEAAIDKASIGRAEVALAAAKLAFERTKITAPISGVAHSKVGPGAFVEAEAGTVPGRIAQTDLVLVGYLIPGLDVTITSQIPVASTDTKP